MSIRLGVRAATLLSSAALLLAACGDSGAAEPSNDSNEQPSAAAEQPATAVDPAALDTGAFPTQPAPAFGETPLNDVLRIEGQRMAEFVVLPFEIDAQFTDGAGFGGLAVSPNSAALQMELGADGMRAVNDAGFLAGFRGSAQTPSGMAIDPQRRILHGLLRFGDAESAKNAARGMYQANITQDPDDALSTVSQEDEIGGLDATFVTSTAYENAKTGVPEVLLAAFTPRNDYVIWTSVQGLEGELDWAKQTAARALELQIPLADAFPATPTTAQNGGVPPELPVMDQDSILIYAIAREDTTQWALGTNAAVYGPRGAAHRSVNPQLAYQVLTAAGAEHNASDLTTVYRAADDAGAQTIENEFFADLLARGYTEADPPRGLSSALCAEKDTVAGTEYACFTREGRYVAEAGGGDKREVHQAISAQYLILLEADQDY